MAEDMPGSGDGDVVKTIVHGGRGEIPDWHKNTKVEFHYRASRLCDGTDLRHSCDDCRLLDDTRSLGGGPFELLIGREFKVPVWEECLKTMRVGEVAAFSCQVQHCLNYSFVATAWRSVSAKRAGRAFVPPAPKSSCCGGMLQSTGHKDLDAFNAAPGAVCFEFELVTVKAAHEHERSSWALTRDEKEAQLPKLRDEGKALFGRRDYAAALDKFSLAESYCADVTSMDVKGSEHRRAVERDMLVPLLVNSALCLRNGGEFAEAAERCAKALAVDDAHVKAHFIHGGALAGCWRLDEARREYARAVELDPTLAATVAKKLAEIERLEQEKLQSDRNQCQRMFSS